MRRLVRLDSGLGTGELFCLTDFGVNPLGETDCHLTVRCWLKICVHSLGSGADWSQALKRD